MAGPERLFGLLLGNLLPSDQHAHIFPRRESQTDDNALVLHAPNIQSWSVCRSSGWLQPLVHVARSSVWAGDTSGGRVEGWYCLQAGVARRHVVMRRWSATFQNGRPQFTPIACTRDSDRVPRRYQRPHGAKTMMQRPCGSREELVGAVSTPSAPPVRGVTAAECGKQEEGSYL